MRVGAKRRIMCGLGLVLVGPVMGVLSANGAHAATGAEKLAPVDVVEVSGIVDAIVAQSIGESIERSQNNGAQAVVLQFNTKGAVVGRDRMAEIATAIQESKIPVAIWVGPSGSRADGTWCANGSYRNNVVRQWKTFDLRYC